MNFLQSAVIFKEIENISFLDCNNDSFLNTKTCESLKSSLILDKFIIPGLNNSYFNDSAKKEINKNNAIISFLELIEYFLIIIAILMGLFIYLYAEEKDL
jgi:hypothetical protein